jgi:hypothetical protein
MLTNMDIRRVSDEKKVFFENWTVKNLPRLAFLFGDSDLPLVYRLAIPNDMKDLLARVRADGPSEGKLTLMLYEYWRLRALKVLSGYADHHRPVLDFDRRTPIAYESINLLSDRGAWLLSKLKSGARPPIYTLKSAARKEELDLSLFIDIDPVIDDVPIIDLNHGRKNARIENFNRIVCSSGCSNGCPWCDETDRPFPYSMPFPIYLRILSRYAAMADEKRREIRALFEEIRSSKMSPRKVLRHIRGPESAGRLLREFGDDEDDLKRFEDFYMSQEVPYPWLRVITHDEGDPLSYFDSVIGADFGDLCRRADSMGILLAGSGAGLSRPEGAAELALKKKNYSKLSKDSKSSAPVFREKDGGVMVDAHGRIVEKHEVDGLSHREFRPVDIYGRQVDDPDRVRQSVSFGASRYAPILRGCR